MWKFLKKIFKKKHIDNIIPDNTPIYFRLYRKGYYGCDMLQYSFDNKRTWQYISTLTNEFGVFYDEVFVTVKNPWYDDFINCKTYGEFRKILDQFAEDPCKNNTEYVTNI